MFFSSHFLISFSFFQIISQANNVFSLWTCLFSYSIFCPFLSILVSILRQTPFIKQKHIRYCTSFINAVLQFWTHRVRCMYMCVCMVMCHRCMCTLVYLVDELRHLPWHPMRIVTTPSNLCLFYVPLGVQTQYHHILRSVEHQPILFSFSVCFFFTVVPWMLGQQNFRVDVEFQMIIGIMMPLHR